MFSDFVWRVGLAKWVLGDTGGSSGLDDRQAGLAVPRGELFVPLLSPRSGGCLDEAHVLLYCDGSYDLQALQSEFFHKIFRIASTPFSLSCYTAPTPDGQY